MASKQLGKLRQWAGEVISTKDKTTVSEEFRQREKEIELRKDGLNRLHIASESYLNHISKKKESEALDDAEKLLPIDTLGIVMVVHGEEIAEVASSHFSDSLVKLGRVHCRLATIQETYALTFKDTVVASIERFQEDITEYEALRKKLESRRLTLDAAITKLDKAKKDKDKKEAEEEMTRAKARYEETEADVHGYMKVIQDNEIDQQRVLGSFLDIEINYATQYLDLLKEVKAEWSDGSILSKPKAKDYASPVQTHVFARPSKEPPKFSSTRSKQSLGKNGSAESSDEDDYHSARSQSHSRRQSISSNTGTPRKRKDSTGTNGNATLTKSPSLSRPSSRASRKSFGETDGKKLSVANWVGSVTGKGKKSRERLGDDDDDAADAEAELGSTTTSPASKRTSSFKKMLSGSGSKSKESITSSPVQKAKQPLALSKRKWVKALHDFSSDKSDELSFEVGDEIVVLSEVLDGWWMGELNGQKGLFPTTYTEVISGPSRPSLPPRLPTRPTATTTYDSEASEDDHHGEAYDPSGSPFIGESTEEEVEKQERQGLVNPSFNGSSSSHKDGFLKPRAHASSFSSSASSSSRNILSNTTSLTSSNKRAPPPPPPRRSTLSSSATNTSSSRPGSSSGSLPLPPQRSLTTPAATTGYDVSPFDSAVDLGAESEDQSGCGDFQQNPFKPKGMCANCFEYHSGT